MVQRTIEVLVEENETFYEFLLKEKIKMQDGSERNEIINFLDSLKDISYLNHLLTIQTYDILNVITDEDFVSLLKSIGGISLGNDIDEYKILHKTILERVLDNKPVYKKILQKFKIGGV